MGSSRHPFAASHRLRGNTGNAYIQTSLIMNSSANSGAVVRRESGRLSGMVVGALACFASLTLQAQTPDATVAGNAPLTVQITRPASDAVFFLGSNIAITALVSTGGVAVVEVAFYVVGQQLLAADSTVPYSTVWRNVPIGSYTLRAVALGADDSIASAQVNITVVAMPPVIQIANLANNTLVRANTDLAIGVLVWPGTHPVSIIELYANTERIGEDVDSPYGITWSAVPVGYHTLRAVG